MSLSAKKCVPCEGGTPPMEHDKVQEYLKKVKDWELEEDKFIKKTFKFKTFRESIDFVNQVARLAEEQNHHPDIAIRFRKVTFELTTHAVKGLSENDFIMASKIDLLHDWEDRIEKVMVSKIVSIKFLIAVIVVLIGILLLKSIL